LALESHPNSRAYVVHRDSLVVKKEASGSRALLSIDEALKYGANPGTIFLGLRNGAAVRSTLPVSMITVISRTGTCSGLLRLLAEHRKIHAMYFVHSNRTGQPWP
jgi:hypothetical protein